ncbi:DUF883 family protein [Afifella marina]|uniref:Membrane-anchored ribosome-binding protein, inhibits growth in stationary phase, ElaB/YqjD/DUF883 family n=1 Tax=Afifella marina DSM 2698 TaxID=1120955 RepID=A0A1G5P5J9_AFIMA|nr:DUF883 family protein [Afifella marina]MBK1625150.1 DUF883 domain-containing protein [Afifella marina DSM 2698]MBK1627054.1 DUF883 domain-containing protein [Afifella marina]MBK5919391.1 hypothetical protein [Afifella marina]RAI19612.1 hypothetical protein CH311_12485 [Afifella marina DSM 2698]SCZ44812.1 protein of unknown function [Afifella marina DSM 2698]
MAETNVPGGKSETERKADDTKRKAEDVRHDLNAEFEILKADVAELSTRISDLLRTGAREGKDMLNERADYYRREGRRRADAAMSEAEALSDDLSQSISRNPFTAVLVALGLGFLVGAISRR